MFYVTVIIDLPILGEHACDLLNFVKKVDIIDESKGLTLDSITHNFAAVFTGRGLYQEKYHIIVKKDAKPVIQQPRHIAYALRPKLREVLDGLSKDGIIADVDCPTAVVLKLCVATPRCVVSIFQRRRGIIWFCVIKSRFYCVKRTLIVDSFLTSDIFTIVFLIHCCNG